MIRPPTQLLDGGQGSNRSLRINTPSGNYISLPDVLDSLVADPIADLAALIALDADHRGGFQMVGRVPYFWDSTRTDNDATNQLVARPSDIASNEAGRWVIAQSSYVLSLDVTYATADGATLYTVPAGVDGLLLSPRCYYDVSADFTGGSSSTIGASSSNTAYNTAGDLQGGAAGDAAAALTAGIRAGTVGAKFASNGLVVLVPGDTIKHNRITSAFTAGAGKLRVPVAIL